MAKQREGDEPEDPDERVGSERHRKQGARKTHGNSQGRITLDRTWRARAQSLTQRVPGAVA